MVSPASIKEGLTVHYMHHVYIAGRGYAELGPPLWKR